MRRHHAWAQYFLGLMYELGRGVGKDDTEAASWYRKAAEQGVSLAQLNLGELYAEGKGVPRDLMQAYLWTELAAQQGDSRAKRRLALETGDILLVGTDGIWETFNPAGEMFGIERLCEILTAHADRSAAEICGAVMNRVREFRGDARPEDDLTLVIARVAWEWVVKMTASPPCPPER